MNRKSSAFLPSVDSLSDYWRRLVLNPGNQLKISEAKETTPNRREQGTYKINYMIPNEFDTYVELKVQDLVSLIIEHEQLEFVKALQFLYESKLYSALLDESTKIWHLSNEKLFEMLKIEKQTNELKYPDFV